MGDYGKAFGDAIMGMVVIAFLLGGALFLGGFFLLRWLLSHLTVGWS